MTSSMLTGEKRWASTRRGGMTVLGKVAVPKPINLPSQRLENHGLDPNVEIVPKGTHSWGSRSSSSSSNAWGSASPSPNTDGDTGSPSHLNGRPSSGGTGTRPSTAGSERGRDPVPNAWGSNSRPSSSSGALSSSQTSHAALRPRSAETRPGSSQLSRFAESLSDSSGAWGGSGTTEKLGVTSSKNDGFSLSSGDFPTLGSEKDNSGKNTESQECGSHGPPVSSSGVASGKERIMDSAGDVSANMSANTGGAGSWRRENSMYDEDGARSNEKWHHDPQPFTNSNILPQHFDGWRGPPVNNHPSGVWLRPPPGGPPFGTVAPGGFPMEPFPYFRPQIPPHSLANPTHVAPGGTGPRGPHPKNGDVYRPQMHDAYMRPVMPVRSGYYPGPIPFDGYYGHHPMGYPNERDAPFIGMAMGPTAYSRYPSQHMVDPGNSHGRTSGFGPGSKAMVSEKAEAAHSHDPRGPYRVLLKQHDGWDGKDEEQKWDDSVKTNAPYSLKGEHQRKLSRENDWRADKEHDEIDTRRMVIGGASSEGVNIQVVPMKVKSPENIPNVNAYDDNSGKKSERAASNFPEILAAPKDSSLIQKIEGLNAKARVSDGRPYAKQVSSAEEQKNRSQVSNTIHSHSGNEVGNDTFSRERAHVDGVANPVSHEDNLSAVDRGVVVESAVSTGTAVSRRSTHDTQGRVDRVKGRFNTHENDGWRKKPQDGDTRNIAATGHGEMSSHSHRQHHISADAGQTSLSQPFGKDDVESVLPVSDPSDNQRAKMSEQTKRRLKEREKEEEERTREQRAKALAKLEELNRRTQTAEGATQKSENALSSIIQNKKNESVNFTQPIAAANKSGLPNSSSKSNIIAQSRDEESTTAPPIVATGKSKSSSSALDFSPRVVAPNNGCSVNKIDKSTSVGGNVLLETSKITPNDSSELHDQLNSFQQDANNADAAPRSSTQRVHDSSGSKHKRTGFRQKQNALEKNVSEKSLPSSVSEGSKVQSDIARDAPRPSEVVADAPISNPDSNMPVNPIVMAESSTHHKKKSRSSKSKHAPTASDSLVASAKPRTPETMLDPNAAHLQNDSKDANQSSELCQSLANEEPHTRASSQWKSHHSRRMTKNSQGNKSVEKNQSGDAVVWAPVRLQNKTEVFEEISQNNVVEAVLTSKSDQQVQNNPRNKRAEMERYIPKPVAKELSQQVVGPLSNQLLSDEIVERPRSTGAESSQTSGTAAGKTVPNMEARNGDGRQNKSGKVHGGAWRQRGVPESSANARSYQNPTEDQHQKPDGSNMEEQPKYHDEWDDGWNMPENPDTAVSVPALKGQSVTARGKRQSHKGNRTSGHNHNPDVKRTGGRDTERVYVESAAPEMHQIESSVASKENHPVGERSTSQWHPKSQSFSASNHRGSRPNSSGNVGSEGGRTNKKDSSQGGGLLPQPDRDSVRARSHHGQSLSEKNNFDEAPSVGHQERKRERKMGGQRGRQGSPHESSSHLNVDARRDQHMSLGFRKSGNQNNRSGRDHDSQGDWNGSGKDNKHQHNAPSNRERPRHNSHYEYQPVGPHNNNKTGNLEPPKEGLHSSGVRYRERGQTRRDGGNFQGRKTGSVQVDGGDYE